MFGDNSSGFANEIEIIKYLNTVKYFDKLNTNFQSFLSFLFNEDLKGKIVSACKTTGQVKPDIIITINNNQKYVSIKKGVCNSVHQENLSQFESFLNTCDISSETINYLKEFHYGDGSIDGTGKNRISALQWQTQNSEKIKQINADFNSQTMLKKVFTRFLFAGNIPNAPIVDIMYHGNINKGLWATRDEIIDYLITTTRNSKNVHFSNLNYQVWNRNLNYNPKTENRRHTMQIKWPSLTKDFTNITEKRANYGKK